MRYITIEEATEGLKLAYDVFDSHGRNLISSESTLTNAYISKLKELGIMGLYIQDELTKDIILEPMISPTLRMKGLSCIREQNIEQCKEIASMIVKEMLEKGTISLDLADLRTFDDYTYAHSVNVAVLSCSIGLGLNLDEENLTNLVLAALLHDIGKLEIPPEILNKPSRLTQEEYQIMKTHSQLSYDLIKDRIDMSAQVKHAVLCHHENYDGSGYPEGLSADQLSILARIIHVADVYDALVSIRPYKLPFSPMEAVDYLLGNSNSMFDPSVVEKFVAYIPFYPKATIVHLSDGTQGVVVDNTGKHNVRPVVRLKNGKNIDLLSEENKDIKIIIPGENRAALIEEAEKERDKMVEAVERHHVIYVTEKACNLENLTKKLFYLYDVTILKSCYQYDLYIKKYDEPDLLIIDIDVSQKKDYETFLSLMYNKKKDYPIIVISEVFNEDVENKLKNLNITNFVLKPYHMSYLKKQIDSLFVTVQSQA